MNLLQPINLKVLIFFLVFTIIFSIPLVHSAAQNTEDVVGVHFINSQPYSFKDDSGYTIVLGEINNTRDFPINGVTIWTGFYNQFSDLPIDTVTGTTILDTIPAHSKSPFTIKSSNPDSAISRVAVILTGFNSAPEKQESLSIQTGILELDNSLYFEGSIRNNGDKESSNTKIYLISNDVFDPPRIVGLSELELSEPLLSNESKKFVISDILNPKAVSFYVLVESENYISKHTIIEDKKINLQSSTVAILDAKATSLEQEKTLVASPVKITAQILMKYDSIQNNEQPFVFYAQVKQADTGIVEFVTSVQGDLLEGEPQTSNVMWIPDTEGLYFIETFIWDPYDVALSPTGPVTLVNVQSE